MNMKDVSKLDGDDLIGLLGLEKEGSLAGSVAAALGIFGAGLIVGIGVGFMLAPKSGRGLREDIRDRLRGTSEILSDTHSSRRPAESAPRAD